MGTELMPASKGNRRGHFEDLEFVRFHETCLDRRGSGALRPPADGVPRFEEEETRAARDLLACRAGKESWGWKDPRTTLFLAAWGGLLPDAFYLLVYRHPVEVALSLARRGLDLEVQLDAWTAIRAWTVYNRQLLAFRAVRPERCLLWSIAGAVSDPAAALGLAALRSGLPLAAPGIDRSYVPGELRSGLRARGIAWRALLPEAMELFDRLEAAADLPGGGHGAARDPQYDLAAQARERELEEANEHLLAAALATAPRTEGGAAVVSAQRRVVYSDLRLHIAQLLDRVEQLEELARRRGEQLEARQQEQARAAATRSSRILHAYWGLARRWRGAVRQSGWQSRKLLGTLPRLRPEDIVIGCVAECHHRSLAQARRLVRSLRWFGGSLAGARMIVCVVGAIAPDEREALERAGAEVRPVERFDRRNPPANKLRFFPEALATGARGLLLLDCDTAVVGDPLPLLSTGALQAKIADVASVTHDAFERLFRHFGLPLPPRRYRTTLHHERTILYCNSGFVFMTRDVAQELAPVWSEWNARVLDVLDLMGPCAHHCHQASLSLALAAHPVPFSEAPPALNFPLHLHPQPPPAAMLAAEPVILHYHDEIDAAGCLLPSALPRVQSRIAALNQRLRAASAEEPARGAEEERAADAVRAAAAPAAARPRLVSIQHRLIGRNGHRFHEALGMQQSADRRGWGFLLLLHREAHPEVRQALRGRAVLHDPVFRDDLSFDARTADFVAMLHHHASHGIRPNDRVLQTVATQCEARAMARWLAELPEARRPWVLVLFLSDRWNRSGEIERQRQLAEFRALADELRALPAKVRRRLIFCSHTDGLRAEITSLLGEPVLLAPMNQATDGLELARRVSPPAVGETPRVVGVLGGARREKGSHLLPAIVEACRRRTPVDFVLQLNNELLAEDEFAALVALARETGVNAAHGALDRDAYIGLLAQCDLVLLPYERRPYRQRQSGILSEAVLAGLPAVVPDGTWLAEQVACGSAAGHIYAGESAEAIAAGVLGAIAELPRLQREASQRAAAWRNNHSLDAFLDWLEAEIAARGSGDVTAANPL